MVSPFSRWRWALVLGLAGLLAGGCGPSPSTTAPSPKAAPTTSGKDGKPAKPPVERDPG
jgi:hypothetical protein